MKYNQMISFALHDLYKYIKENDLSVEDIADSLEITPSVLYLKLQSNDYSFISEVYRRCEELTKIEKRGRKNEYK